MEILIEMFNIAKNGKDVSRMIDDYEVYIRKVEDKTVPHKYLMNVMDINTTDEDYGFFDSILEITRLFQILTKRI